MNKTFDNRAWWLVVPVFLMVAFNALIPLMTVVNFSVQESFGDNVFFWSGITWFEQVLHSERFHAALLRQIIFTALVLVIEIPLGLVIALAMPRKGPWVSVCLVLMALPLLIPWNVVGAMWNIFALPDIGFLGKLINSLGIPYNYTRQPLGAWFTTVLMDVWHWTSLVVLLVLCRARLDPRCLLPGGESRRRQALGGVPLYPTAEAQACAHHRHPACASWTAS